MPLVAWAVADFTRSPQKAQSFIDMLLRCFQVLGKFARYFADFLI
jgi:hypothetical protein